RARGPHLLAGDDDLVALDHAARLHRGQVRTVVRLGEALAVDVLAGDDPGQEVRLLLRGAMRDDGRPGQALAHAPVAPGHARAVEFLVQHGDPDPVEALAAVLF